MRRTLTAVVAAGLLAAAVAPSAQAGTATQSFGPVGAEQTFTVPIGVTSINVRLISGRGGNSTGGIGGFNYDLRADLAVEGGQRLFIEVGGNGARSSSVLPVGSTGAGGFNGGGAGGQGAAGVFAAGGGGATDIRTRTRTDPT